MASGKKYIIVTFRIYPEDDQFVSICEELGTASCGDTLDEASRNLEEAVLLDLNTLEDIGERERFFRERNIRLRSAPAKTSKVPSRSMDIGHFLGKKSIPVSVPA